MPTQVRLAVCHGNRLFRECLTSALQVVEEYEITATGDPSFDGLLPSRTGRPEVLLIDAGLPGSAAFGLIQGLRASHDRPRTILMASAGTPELIESCLRAGADGCVLDDDTLDDLRQAIECVRSGRSYCSPQLAHRLLTRTDGFASPASTPGEPRERRLTRREVEILRLIAQRDFSNKQIARELRLSAYTVKNHVHSIIEKLSVEDRQTAARHALRRGLLTNPLC